MNIKRITLCAITASIILTSCGKQEAVQNSVEAEKPEVSIIVSANDKRQYETLKLDNQIEVILVSDPTLEKSAAALSVGVGMLHDPMSQQGMAHYLEHMLFLGTEKYPDTKGYSEFMTKNGGGHNAYTWLDITNYMFQINNDAYDEALDRFSDFFKAPKLYAEYVDKEKNAVNAEWSMRREMDFFGQFKLNRSMMGSHPANRFLIGNLETLSDKEDSKLHPTTVDFYNKYYSANIMKAALVSNLPLAEMRQLAIKHFSPIKNKNIQKSAVTKKLDFKKIGSKRIYYVPNNDVKQLNLDFTIKNNSAQFRSKPNYFITYLLGSEMPGSPAAMLKGEGLISSLAVGESPALYGNYGSITVNISLTDKGMKHREKITATVMQFLQMIREKGVDSKYFEEIKTSLDNDFRFLEKGDSFGYVANLANEMQTYPLKEVISSPYTYEKFNAKAIENVLAQMTPETLRIWYISKQEPHEEKLHFYDGQYKIESIPQSEIDDWSKQSKYALALPKTNNLLPESFSIKTTGYTSQKKPDLVHDKNGIKVWQYPSQDFAEQPKGVLRVYINSPAKQKNIKGQVYLNLWASLFNLELSELATEASIAGMQTGITAYHGLELGVSGFTDKQLILLEKSLSHLSPTVDEDGFKQAVDRYVRGIKNSENQFPFRQLFGQLRKVVNNASYSNEALISTAKALTLKDFKKFVNQLLKNNQVRIFAFGNYNDEDIKSVVKLVKRALPADRNTTEFTRSQKITPQANTITSLQIDLKVADVALLDLFIHPEANIRQLARANVLSGHLRTQMFDKLRTEEQLAYAVGSAVRKLEDYTGIAFYIQTPVQDVLSIRKRFDRFRSEYAVLLEKITEEEFAQLKNSTLVGLKEKPKNLSEELQPILMDWYHEKWDFNSKQKLIEAVEVVTLEDIKTFYKETLLAKNSARILVELRGSKFKDKPFAQVKGAQIIDSLPEFHSKVKHQ